MVPLWKTVKTKSSQIENELESIPFCMEFYEWYSWNSKRFILFPLKNVFVFLQWPSCLSFTPKYLMRRVLVHLFFSEDHVIWPFSFMPRVFTTAKCVFLSKFENCFVILGIMIAYLHHSEKLQKTNAGFPDFWQN